MWVLNLYHKSTRDKCFKDRAEARWDNDKDVNRGRGVDRESPRQQGDVAGVGGSLCTWHCCLACATVHANNRSGQAGSVRAESLQTLSQSLPVSTLAKERPQLWQEDAKKQEGDQLNLLINLPFGTWEGIRVIQYERNGLDRTVKAMFLAKCYPHEREWRHTAWLWLNEE